MSNLPPDFDLAELRSYDLSLFDNLDKEVLGFILALGTVFNDIKDIDWFLHQLNKFKPLDDKAITAERGQWSGMQNFVIRKSISIISEFFELLKNNHKVFEHQLIKDAELAMDHHYYDQWDQLKETALRRDPKSKSIENRIWLACNDIRNSVTYHYYGLDNYVKGFETFKKEFSIPKVYLSLGENLEGTRFFFSDGATNFFSMDAFRKRNLKPDQVLEYVFKLNQGIRSLMEALFILLTKTQTMNRGLRRKLKSKKRRK